MKDIKKRLLSGIVAGIFVLLPGMKGKVKAEVKGTVDEVTNIKEVVMYNRDNFNSQIINNLRINSVLFRILTSDDLSLVNYNNQLGFIENASIESLGFINSNIKYDEINEFGMTLANVNLRVGPGTDYDNILKIKNGEIIDIIYKSSNGWYLVDYKGILGFISMDYSKVIDFSKLESQINELPKIVKKVVATDNVNIRELPSTESNILGILKEGKRLKIVGVVDNEWIGVTNGTEVGYVKSDYVRIIDSIDGDNYKNVYMTNNTTLYNYPYAGEVMELPKYEMAFVYGETDDFYFVESEKNIGYIRKNDVHELTEPCVVVDISSQQVRLYKGTKEMLVGDIVSGKDSTPSDLGYFTIIEHEPNYTLKTKDYEVKVKYWIRYNKGEGIHDASWRHGEFGGNIYKQKGSHGCINCPTKIAEQIYDEVEIGDKVLVKR